MRKIALIPALAIGLAIGFVGGSQFERAVDREAYRRIQSEGQGAKVGEALPFPSTPPLILTVMSTDEGKQQWSLDAIQVLPDHHICEVAASAEVLRVIAPSRIVYWSCDTGIETGPINSVHFVGSVMRSDKVDRASTPFERKRSDLAGN